jgi:hypothetical protein
MNHKHLQTGCFTADFLSKCNQLSPQSLTFFQMLSEFIFCEVTILQNQIHTTDHLFQRGFRIIQIPAKMNI